MPYYVYILKSCEYNRRYIGSCSDIDVRLKYHNNGRVRSTKAYKPYKIIYAEEYQTRSEAVRRERFFKTIGYIFLKEIGVYDK